MTRAILMALGTGAAISSVAAIGIAASTADESRALGREEYETELRFVASSRGEAIVHCEQLAGSAREICRTEAQAREMVRVAEVENDFRRNQQAARALQRARIDARYQVERARCNALGGFKRDRCMVDVHAVRGRSLMQAAAPYELRYQ